MITNRAPLRVARAGVELAVQRLPELDDRLGYRAEFLAELHSLPPSAQLRYTAGVLSQASPCAPRWTPLPLAPRRPR